MPEPLATDETRAKFLEAYAEPVVTNTYLKISVLVLAAVSLVLLLLYYRTQTAALRMKPLIIAVTDSGRGQVMRYDDFRSVPIERVSKYYLARWAELYYGRNHATLQRDFAESLNFFSDALANSTLAEVQKSKMLDSFLLDPSQSNVDVEIKAVVLEDLYPTKPTAGLAGTPDLRQTPYRAHIEFEKIFRALGDQQVEHRERWTSNVVYAFRDQVPNDMLLSNPLGLVISYCREDQAFGN
jgi:type IV secretion system protein VirB5